MLELHYSVDFNELNDDDDDDDAMRSTGFETLVRVE